MDDDVSLVRRLRAVRPAIVDAAVAAALFTVAVVETVTELDCQCVSRTDVTLTVIFLVAMTLPLVWRRRFPFAVLTVVGLAKVLYSDILSVQPDPFTAVFPVLLAVYSVAAYARRSLSIAGGVLTLIALLAFNISEFGSDFADLATQFAFLGGAWIVGDNTRYRRRQAELLRDRAERAEREREEQARLGAMEERARIAREIHDVVTHSVSVIAVQAGAARRVVETTPEKARDALASIERISRETMAELRGAVGVLRGGEGGAALTPQPGLARLDDLVRQFRDAGMNVEVSTEGTRRNLPAGLDLSAYRVVQEALTNTLRHAGQTVAHVRVRYGPGALELVVADEGGGGPGADAGTTPAGVETRSGHGLEGMRERVTAYGGTLEAGPANGGFLIRAVLPFPEQQAGGT